MRNSCILLLTLVLGFLAAHGQSLPLQVQSREGMAPTLRSQQLLPRHVLQNPQSHSTLCRLESKIEAKSPVGLWLKIDGNLPPYTPQVGWVSCRLRLPLGPVR